MKKKIFCAQIITAFICLPFANAQTSDNSKLVPVAKNEDGTVEFYVDTTSLQDFGNERLAFVKERRLPTWYNKIQKEYIEGYDAKWGLFAINCKHNTFSILESSQVNDKNEVIKTEFSFVYGDPSRTYTEIKQNSIVSGVANFVCSQNIAGKMSGDAPIHQSKIIKDIYNKNDWASLGPSANNEFSFYLLKPSIVKKGNYVGYITKIEFANPKIDSGQPIKSIVSENVFDCRNQKYQAIRGENFNPQGSIVSENNIDPQFAQWSVAEKGSFAERIGNVYCKK